MQKKISITLDESIYLGLCQITEKNKINQLIEDLLKWHVLKTNLYEGYRQMAADQNRESEAMEWAEATIGDISDETW